MEATHATIEEIVSAGGGGNDWFFTLQPSRRLLHAEGVSPTKPINYLAGQKALVFWREDQIASVYHIVEEGSEIMLQRHLCGAHYEKKEREAAEYFAGSLRKNLI